MIVKGVENVKYVCFIININHPNHLNDLNKLDGLNLFKFTQLLLAADHFERLQPFIGFKK
jgi:hypothetical protein